MSGPRKLDVAKFQPGDITERHSRNGGIAIPHVAGETRPPSQQPTRWFHGLPVVVNPANGNLVRDARAGLDPRNLVRDIGAPPPATERLLRTALPLSLIPLSPPGAVALVLNREREGGPTPGSQPRSAPVPRDQAEDAARGADAMAYTRAMVRLLEHAASLNQGRR